MRTWLCAAVILWVGCSGKSPGGPLGSCRLTTLTLTDLNEYKHQTVGLIVNATRGDSVSTLTVHWSVQFPDGSTHTGDRTQDTPFNVTTDLAGTYAIQASATDSCGDSAPVQAKLNVENRPPVAGIGLTLTTGFKHLGNEIRGGGSDPDGDPITYRWSIASGPDGGSGSFEPPDTATTIFTPALEGSYVVQLVTHDGTEDSAPAQETITAADHPPTADAGYRFATSTGAPTAVIGSGSDADRDPLSYQWSLLSAPSGSTATLQNATSAVTTLTPDLEGAYTLQLVTRDTSFNSPPSTTTVTAYHPVFVLPHDVVNAAYDPTSGRIVFTSASPSNALYLYDPGTHAETQIALSSAPVSLSLRPDGAFASVGHLNAVSDVNLSTSAVSSWVVTGNVVSVARAASKIYFIAVPSGAFSEPLSTLDPSSGNVSTSTGNVSPYSYLVLHPSQTVLYGGETNSIFKATIANSGTAQVGYSAANDTCGGLWYIDGGTELITRCGTEYGLNPGTNNASNDFTALGTIPWPSGNLGIYWIDYTGSGGELAVDPSYGATPSSQSLLLDSGDLTQVNQTLSLPPFINNGYVSSLGEGIFVFHGPGGERYVVLESLYSYPSTQYGVTVY